VGLESATVPSGNIRSPRKPSADAAAIIWGPVGRYIVAFGAVISTFGALNGCILIQGQIPLAAARDNMFPEIFKYQNSKDVPIAGIVIASILVSAIMMMNFTRGLTDTFTFLVLLSTLIVLVPYVFSAASLGVIVLQEKFWKRDLISKIIISAIAFIYSMWAIVGSGEKAVYWGLIGLLAGIPFLRLDEKVKRQ
jgi:APA family basic amino acid/polyamine antiporter